MPQEVHMHIEMIMFMSVTQDTISGLLHLFNWCTLQAGVIESVIIYK